MGSDLVVTSAVSAEECKYRLRIFAWKCALSCENIKSSYIPIILIQPQLLLLPGGMDVPENYIIKIDRIRFIHIKEEAI